MGKDCRAVWYRKIQNYQWTIETHCAIISAKIRHKHSLI